jgi:hypothetical protein
VLPALGAIALASGLCVAVVVIETIRYRSPRAQLRDAD